MQSELQNYRLYRRKCASDAEAGFLRDWDSLLIERSGGLWLPTHAGGQIAEQAAAVEDLVAI